jgi:hypothetical protein
MQSLAGFKVTNFQASSSEMSPYFTALAASDLVFLTFQHRQNCRPPLRHYAL